MNRIPTLCSRVGAAVVAVAVASTAGADEFGGGVPGEWLARWTGARTVGVGGAYVAWAQSPIGALWNPAGLSRLDRNEVHFETAQLFEDTAMHGFSFAAPNHRFPSFGFTMVTLQSGTFEKTNDLNETVGSFHEGDVAFLFTASKGLSRRLSLGTNLKVVRQSIDEFDAAGWGVDLGVLYDVTPRFRVGTSVQNLGGPGLTLRETRETYPVELRGGIAASILSGRGLITTEIDHTTGPGTRIRGGTEYWLHPSMALRFGYVDDAPSGGFSYQVAPDSRFDYGVSTHELGVTHRFALSYQFGGFHATSQADPDVFSPLGERPVTKFQLKAHTKAETESWSLAITDKLGAVVREFGGAGSPPAHVMWDGKDVTGLPLADGSYSYRLVVVDAEGRELAGNERAVRLSTSGPRGSVPVLVN